MTEDEGVLGAVTPAGLKALRKLLEFDRDRSLGKYPATAKDLGAAGATLKALADRGLVYAYDVAEGSETAQRWKLTGYGAILVVDFERGVKAAKEGRPEADLVTPAGRHGWKEGKKA